MLEASRCLAGGGETDAILESLLRAARQLTGARHAAIALREEPAGVERLLFSGEDGDARRRLSALREGGPQADRKNASLELPIASRGERLGSLHLIDPPAQGFDADGLEAAELLAGWASLPLAQERVRRLAERRLGDAERASRALEATTSMALAVGGETDLNRVLEAIARRARALVEARTVVVALREGERLEIVFATGEFEPVALGTRLELTPSWRRVLESGAPERLGMVAAELGVSARELGVEARSALLAALRFRGRELGVIAAFDRLQEGPGFDAEDVGLMVSFASSAATAVATAQSVAAERLRNTIDSAERERGRWARELHDETLQGLGALRVLLSSALSRPEDGLRSLVGGAIDQLDGEIANLRGLIAELRPVALDQLGLAAALEGLADHHSAVSGFEVNASLELGAESLHPELESNVYRVVQEALTNVAKHADAGSVVIDLSRVDGTLNVLVSDDGSGFSATQPPPGFGLVGMRERVELAGGELEVQSAPGAGTTVMARLPAETQP